MTVRGADSAVLDTGLPLGLALLLVAAAWGMGVGNVLGLACQVLLLCLLAGTLEGTRRRRRIRFRAMQAGLEDARHRAEAEARKSTAGLQRRSAFLAGLIDILGVLVVAVDEKGSPELWNAASRTAQGTGGNSTRPPDNWSAAVEVRSKEGTPMPRSEWPITKALRGEPTEGVELQIVTARSIRNIHVTTGVIRLPDGELAGVVTAGHDITSLRRRERDLERINRDLDSVARAKTAVLAGSDARSAACQAALEITGGLAAVLMEPAAGGQLLCATHAAGFAMPPITVAVTADSRLAHAYRTGRTVILDDVRAVPGAYGPTLDEIDDVLGDAGPMRAAVCLPVVRGGHVRGVLLVVLSAPASSRDGSHLALLEMLAGDAGLALERDDLLQRLSGEAMTDPLTALPNRRAWDDALFRELERAKRESRPLTVALLDMDYFKRFNDTQGHPAGDTLLAQAAQIWRHRLRTGDTLARLGGEEFGVILPDCEAADAAALVGRLLAELPSNQTCSGGLAQWQGDSTRALLTRADAALYRAKANGRAQLCVADSGSGPAS